MFNFINELINQQEACKFDLIDMKKRLDSTISDVMALRQNLKLSIDDRNSIKREFELCQTEKNELIDKVNDLNNSLKKSDNDNKKLIESIVYLEKDLAESKIQSKDLHSKFELKHIEFNNVNNEMKQKNDSIDSLTKQINFYIKQKESDSMKVINLEKKLNALLRKFDDISKELNNSRGNETSLKNHISKLELSVQNVLSEKLILQKIIKKTSIQSNQFDMLEKQLDFQRIKCIHLTNELKTPVNIDRRRFIKSKYPKSYELLERNRIQQKRIFYLNNKIGKMQNIILASANEKYDIEKCQNESIMLKKKLTIIKRCNAVKIRKMKTNLVEHLLSKKK